MVEAIRKGVDEPHPRAFSTPGGSGSADVYGAIQTGRFGGG